MIDKLLDAIREADGKGVLPCSEQDVLSGYSGERVIGALQRMTALYAHEPGLCYLEVGVFQGLTLLSVADANRGLPCFGVDNFAFFDAERTNQSLVLERTARLGLDNAILVNMDYEDALEQLPAQIGRRRLGVYFVDGPHDYRSQLMCLLLAVPHIASHGVIVVDDANYPHVRQANRDFLLCHPEFKLLFEAYTPARPLNFEGDAREAAIRGWWNGINVIVHDPRNRLPAAYPPTDRNRKLFENEHVIMSSRLCDHFPLLGRRVQHVVNVETRRFPREAWRFARWMWSLRSMRFRGRYTEMNTYSEALPARRYHEPC